MYIRLCLTAYHPVAALDIGYIWCWIFLILTDFVVWIRFLTTEDTEPSWSLRFSVPPLWSLWFPDSLKLCRTTKSVRIRDISGSDGFLVSDTDWPRITRTDGGNHFPAVPPAPIRVIRKINFNISLWIFHCRVTDNLQKINSLFHPDPSIFVDVAHKRVRRNHSAKYSEGNYDAGQADQIYICLLQ